MSVGRSSKRKREAVLIQPISQEHDSLAQADRSHSAAALNIAMATLSINFHARPLPEAHIYLQTNLLNRPLTHTEQSGANGSQVESASEQLVKPTRLRLSSSLIRPSCRPILPLARTNKPAVKLVILVNIQPFSARQSEPLRPSFFLLCSPLC